ncbi:C2H2-type domain-containing protein [Aphis craccivora]|uniref:C2H2-type domain-containing protein n=1 Tax=Aphis craccivora TaxID=307492 RepID=A0A6G0VR24_APHCR|nr:C2H2-type domain-containing protein [Aphis craccivora]
MMIFVIENSYFVTCLLIFCKNMDEAKKLHEAIFIITFSKYDGHIIQAIIMVTENSTVDDIINNIENYDHEIPERCDEDINEENANIIYFNEWTREISMKCEILVENVIGEYENAQ